MANLVNLESVSKSYGVRPLLDAVSLGVGEGDRIGVVGLNGGGKTTLLEVLAGIEPADSGRVSRTRDLRMAVVTQRTDLPPGGTVRNAVLDPLGFSADHEWAADAKVRAVLDGIGISALGLDAPLDRMSGGERRRVALAAALVQELDLVILDEPTNHLDIEGVRWLADHLLARRTALVVVTHDRWFLDTVCSRTWEVQNGRVEQYEGGYADWVFARAERGRLADTLEEKRRNLAAKELAWLRRGAPARTSKPRYRIDAAEALIANVPPPRDTVELMAFAKRRLGKTVIELEDATLSVPGRRLLDHVTWRIGPGDRIGLVGVNGSGKTTLLRLLAGESQPETGKRIQGQTVHLAYLSQELADLPGELRVLEAIEEIARRVTLGKQELSASQLAEKFGFPANRQWTPVSDLSGGERRRLQLSRLLMAEPNVLLLDEPTNDLDIDTLQQLEDLLDSWPGTLVVVSHDRYLVERVCDEVYALFGDGRAKHLPGGIEEYLTRRATMTAPVAAPVKADKPKSAAADQRAAGKELARLERALDKLSKREAQLHTALAEAATDPDRLLELDAQLRDLVKEKAEVEERWMEIADSVE
ncbi:ABC-F family ATP-binding cassette domain-containing protein [Kibdelosporangium phytohabitans]|uniref:Glycerophosphodiester phosphodiesterase n=1 Tax=Kibdelosporangium phytohabitans TaxID=860235 RepID=A0A0N9HPA3_9PSEU|nr:ABC-F family ATP-binding cassette domain-containing protein [Kibdelosporangium phytohabitans]ALG06501.1 glycerophosphodiester phosphodiesterase [Kibdelosporangium phytohabitans]MBE1467677.1 ATP-binding cassette subfamily F protein uup [Kibdelosporangium phytohabitans]